MSATTHQPTTEDRLYEIDLFRFISALMVVIFHYTFTAHMEGFAPIADFPNAREISRYAYMGINFFFVISGFVIFMSLDKTSANQFAVSRFKRLFPAYWAALIITSIFTLIIGGERFNLDWTMWLSNLIMIHPLFDQPHVDTAYWTLYVELKFYVLAWLLMKFNKLHWAETLIGLILIASTLALFTEWGRDVQMFSSIFPHWSGYFAAGSCLYLIRRDGWNLLRSGLFALSIVYIVCQSVIFGQLMQGWFRIEFNGYIIAAMNLIFMAAMLLTLRRGRFTLRNPKLLYLGLLTYPLYLLHQHIGYMIFNLWGNHINPATLVTLTIFVMLIGAWLLHRLVEAPIQKYLKPAR